MLNDPVYGAGVASDVQGVAEVALAAVVERAAPAMPGMEEEAWVVVAGSVAHFRSEKKCCRRSCLA